MCRMFYILERSIPTATNILLSGPTTEFIKSTISRIPIVSHLSANHSVTALRICSTTTNKYDRLNGIEICSRYWRGWPGSVCNYENIWFRFGLRLTSFPILSFFQPKNIEFYIKEAVIAFKCLLFRNDDYFSNKNKIKIVYKWIRKK